MGATNKKSVGPQGYWNYDHMVVQMEDCIDVMTVLFPSYDYLFLFDHSCGHEKQREDGLNMENMSKTYGGKQRLIQPTLIKEEAGYLGTYPRKLNPGDIQHMIFTEHDEGPFWMSSEECKAKRHDKVEQNKVKKRKYTKDELITKLQMKNVTATGSYNNIKRLCELNGIELFEVIPKVVEGWQGKAKGMLQVAWERGLIDEKNLSLYPVTGCKDELGIMQQQTSLKFLIGNCSDFEEEESLLQSKGRLLGAIIDRTPKCHCELAGEGIEYSWGCAKNHFRQQPLRVKRTKENFRTTVKMCLSRNVLSTERIRKFSRRARQYVLAYHALHSEQQQQISTEQSETYLITPMKIESLVKKFKTHRCALDFDKGFIKAAITTADE